MLSPPKVSAKTEAVSTKCVLSASVGHTVADELFSFSPMTLDEQNRFLSHAPAECPCFYTSSCYLHVSKRRTKFRPQHHTRSVRSTSLHSVPFHSLHHFAFDGLGSSYQPAAGVAYKWLPPFLDLSCTRRDTVKRRSCRTLVLVLLVLEVHIRSFANVVASHKRQLSSLMTLLPSSQIAVKVADTSPRNEQVVVSVASLSQLTLRRPCCFFSAHVARLSKCGDLSLSGILDAVAKMILQSHRLFNRRANRFE